jgi:hypothetical protein
MIKVHFKLPYRMLEGLAKFLFPQMGKSTKTPTYSLVCKRAKHVEMSKLSSRQPINLSFGFFCSFDCVNRTSTNAQFVFSSKIMRGKMKCKV